MSRPVELDDTSFPHVDDRHNDFSDEGDDANGRETIEIQYTEDGSPTVPNNTRVVGNSGGGGYWAPNAYGCGPADLDVFERRIKDSGSILRSACANWKSFKFLFILWVFIIMVCSLVVFGELRKVYNVFDAKKEACEGSPTQNNCFLTAGEGHLILDAVTVLYESTFSCIFFGSITLGPIVAILVHEIGNLYSSKRVLSLDEM
jgi:hypothetical protein